MTVLQWGIAKTGLGAGVHPVGSAHRGFNVRVASAAGGFSVTFRGEAAGDPTASSPQVGYRDVSADPDAPGAAGATAITADGLYEVPSNGRTVALHVTAGTATVTVTPDDG
jgi:hypothetical protein